MAILVDFKCNHCDNIFEAFVYRGHEDNIKCPKCSSKGDVTKLLSAPAQLNTNGVDKNSHRTSNNRHKR